MAEANTTPHPGVYVHFREYPALSEASSDATGPDPEPRRDLPAPATPFFDGLLEVVDTGVRAVALESAAAVVPLYEEHPRTPGTLWERLGWLRQILLAPAVNLGVGSLIDSPLMRLRLSARLSQSNIAFRLGVSQQAVSAWERGVSPVAPRYIPALASALQLTPDELMRKLAPGMSDPRD